MKKIISLVLLMSFIMSSLLTFPVKAADKKDVKTDERIETLTGIGLIDYTDDVIDLPITRAEFADIMATILGFQEQIRLEAWYQYFLGEDKNDDLTIETNGKTFTDVGDRYWAYSAIEKLADSGYISGNGEGRFEPDRSIKYEEAVKVLASAMGYDSIMATYSDWRSGCVQTAQSLGLNKGISASVGSDVTRRDFAYIIYNAFDVPILEKTPVIGKGEEIKADKDKTFLSEILKMGRVRGIVTANGDTTLTAPGSVAENYMEVGKTALIDNKNFGSLIGRKVYAYYSLEEDNEDEVIYAYAIDEVSEIDISSVEKLDNGDLYYRVKNSVKKIRFDKKPLIYNGVCLNSYDDDLFDGKSGKILITQNDSESVVIAQAYESYYVKSVDAENETVYDGIFGKKISINASNDNVSIFDEFDAKLDFSGITVGNVISIAENGRVKKIYVSTKQESGKIESKAHDENEIVKINGKSYEIDTAFASTDRYNSISVGDSVVIYINTFGTISWIDNTVDGPQNAYLLKAYECDNGSIMVKYLDADGVLTDKTISEKAILTKKSDEYLSKQKSSDKDAYTELAAYGKGYFRIRVNKDDLISEIEVPGTKSINQYNERMNQTSDNIEMSYVRDQGEFYSRGYRIGISDDTYIISVPDDENDYTKYRKIKKSDFSNKQKLFITAYSNNYGTLKIDAMSTHVTISDNFGSGSYALAKVVTKVTTGVNDENEIVKMATLSNGEKETVVWSETSGDEAYLEFVPAAGEINPTKKLTEFEYAEPIKVGDMVFCIANSDGKVRKIARLFDPNKPAKYADGNKGGVPVADDELFNVPTSADAVDISTGRNDAMKKAFHTTPFSNPFTVADIPHTWDTLSLYPLDFAMRVMLGYVYYKTDENSIVYTTQDLSASGQVFKENGIPDDAAPKTINGTEYIPIYIVDHWQHGNTLGTYQMMSVTYNGDRNVEVKKGSINDIRDYMSAKTDCSRILTVATMGAGRQIVIINDNR